MSEISHEKMMAFAMRRFNSITSDETVGQSYEVIFGECPDAEEQGRKMLKRSPVKKKMDEMLRQMQDWSVANVGQTAVLAENNFKEFLTRALLSAPEEAAMDNPLCDVKVLKDGTKIPVFPEKSNMMNLMARVLKMVGSDVSVQFNLPSWEPSQHIEGQKNWVVAQVPQLTESREE